MFRCFECKKNIWSTYEFCSKDINKFIFLLRKGIYPYEHIDSLEIFNEIWLPDKETLK